MPYLGNTCTKTKYIFVVDLKFKFHCVLYFHWLNLLIMTVVA